MKFLKQQAKINMNNLDGICGAGIATSSTESKHGPLLPNTVRCIMCGPSNCGKTNVLVNLLLDENGVKFENLYIYSKSLNQPKYALLEKIIRTADDRIGIHTFSDSEVIMKPSEAKPNSVFVFDDVACDNQNVIREYFSMGRHASVDCFYLNQSYARIPKHLIRDNANMLVLFKQDDTNSQHVYREHVNGDMTFQQFKNVCIACWKDNYGFLVIDKDKKIDEGRYRKNFDKIIVL